MSMTAEPAQAQAAFEAGELDMVLTPTEDIQRVKADPMLGPHGRHESRAFAITYYTYNNFKTKTDQQARRPTRTSGSR